MTFGSLFTGIGGFDIGFETAGMKCAWQVEIDKTCQSVLKRHWPNVKRYDDVKKCGQRNLEPVDVICGGFPCQDLSVAGRREGLAGEQSGLWFEFHRILEELRPQYAVIENVPGILSGCGCTTCQAVGRIIRIHKRIRRREGGRPCALCVAGKRMLASHSGRNLAIVLQGLVELGYGVAYRVFDAQFFGVAQRRRRVFIIGSFGTGSTSQILFEREGMSRHSATRRKTWQEVAFVLNASIRKSGDGHGNGLNSNYVSRSLTAHGMRLNGYSETFVADTVTWTEAHNGNSNPISENIAKTLINHKDHTYQFMINKSGVRRLTPRECERLQGFEDDWTRWDEQGNEISDSKRYRMLGNAVCTKQSLWLGKRIVEQGL